MTSDVTPAPTSTGHFARTATLVAPGRRTAETPRKDLSMAKALFGYVGGPDPRLVSEVRRLQQRVQDLEAELLRMQAEYDHLAAAFDSEHIIVESTPEPVLA